MIPPPRFIKDLNIPESQKRIVYENLLRLQKQKINIMITGATGTGKSSTINAMFRHEVAKVGVGIDPETINIFGKLFFIYDIENYTTHILKKMYL